MAIRFLTDAERARLSDFPGDPPLEDIIAFFTLSASDRAAVPKTSSASNRLGFALQLGTLRYLGFCPSPITRAPDAVVEFVARQLRVAEDALQAYGHRRATVTEHFAEVQAHLGFHRATAEDKRELTAWLAERALEHDRPTLLLELACDRLRGKKIVRPALNRLERIVAVARIEARRRVVVPDVAALPIQLGELLLKEITEEA